MGDSIVISGNVNMTVIDNVETCYTISAMKQHNTASTYSTEPST